MADNSSSEEFRVERDGHLVANQDATGLERCVPSQTKVFAVDLCGRGYRNSGTAPGILRRRSWPVHGKEHFAGDTANGQVALYRQLSVPDKPDVRGLERQGGKLFHVEEVGTLQVRIALSVSRFNGGRFDHGFDARVCQVGFVQS